MEREGELHGSVLRVMVTGEEREKESERGERRERRVRGGKGERYCSGFVAPSLIHTLYCISAFPFHHEETVVVMKEEMPEVLYM